MSLYDCDLFIVGGGSGGIRAARIAAQLGAKVVLAEASSIGGTCVLRGCIPKKLYVYASRFADTYEESSFYGWSKTSPEFNWRSLVSAKDQEVQRLSNMYRQRLEEIGVNIVFGRARITAPHEIILEGPEQKKMSARYILIASGAESTPGSFPGSGYARTSDEIFDLPKFPEHLLVVGSGYIALEFASLFVRLGSQVTLALRKEHILADFDHDLQEALSQELEASGIRILRNAPPLQIDKKSDGLYATHLGNDRIITSNEILLAIGRHPATKGLNLQDIGVQLGKKGEILIDSRNKTSLDSLYAIGDVTGKINLTPVAVQEGHLLAERLFGQKNAIFEVKNIPTAVFTTPEAAGVGLTERQAQSKYTDKDIEIYSTRFKPMYSAFAHNPSQVLLKYIVQRSTERILGIHLVSPEASEMIQLLAISMEIGLTKSQLDSTLAVHPTIGEEWLRMRRT